jgi:pimeloyl-ACP methyl ester carboxylesterase
MDDPATVDHHGRETAYRHADRGGDGPTLLCVHGSGGARGVWKAQHRLADEFPVAALDLGGHGDSADVAAAPGYEARSAYVDDVLAVLREVGASVLVGSSLGGAVALSLAMRRDADVDLDALVLAGTGAKLTVLEDLLAWLEDDFERAVEFLHAPDRLFHDPDERCLEASRAALCAAGREVVRRDFLTCHRFDVRDRFGGIETPALAIVGEHDRLTPPWYHEYLRDELPNGELAVVEDAAHLAMLERPAAFNAAVGAFLRQL